MRNSWRGAVMVLGGWVVATASVGLADVVLTVNGGGGAQYTSVQAAVNAVPTNPGERYVIRIAPGTYTEQINVNKPNVLFQGTGSDASKTVLSFNQNAQPGNPLANASTAITAKDFVAQNLTFANTAGDNTGPGLAVYVKADRAVFDDCRFLGWQDTLRPEKQRSYFRNCYIEGDVDFIYGQGKAYFEDCTIYAKSGGYVTAQGREGANDDNGFVFLRADVEGSAPNASVYLGRPWQAYARVIFLESTLGKVVNPAGWATWGGNNHLTSYFAEYDSQGPGAAGTRASWSHQLTAQEIAPYSLQNWLGGSDHWDPVAAIPEPGGAAMLLGGAAALGLRRTRAHSHMTAYTPGGKQP